VPVPRLISVRPPVLSARADAADAPGSVAWVVMERDSNLTDPANPVPDELSPKTSAPSRTTTSPIPAAVAACNKPMTELSNVALALATPSPRLNHGSTEWRVGDAAEQHLVTGVQVKEIAAGAAHEAEAAAAVGAAIAVTIGEQIGGLLLLPLADSTAS